MKSTAFQIKYNQASNGKASAYVLAPCQNCDRNTIIIGMFNIPLLFHDK